MRKTVYAAIGAGLLIPILVPTLAVAGTGDGLEVRFCPGKAVRSYLLAPGRGLQSLLLQNAAVINHRAAPVEITDIDVELLRDGAVVETRHLAGADIARMAKAGQGVQKSGMLKAVAFQFCGTDMIRDGVTVAGPALAHDQALLVMQQPFVYSGARDTLRLSIHATSAGHEEEASASLPIWAGFAKGSYRFPLKGIWYVGNSPSFNGAHRWAVPEEFAFDIAKIGGDGLTHRGDGTHMRDYYAYGAEVDAAADGRVVRVADDQPEDASTLRKPGETPEAFMKRVEAGQMGRLVAGGSAVTGNMVMIDHGNGEYALYAHLKPGSVRVHVGDVVKAGQPIAKLGGSGNSTEPHLHFQVCDRPDPLMCAGIPVMFTNAETVLGDPPAPLQNGDEVITR